MEDGDGGYDFRQISEWSEDDVVLWMHGLGDAVSEHAPQFLAHCICGEDLLKLNRQKLEYLQVTQIGHQELFLEAVELLSRLDKSLNKQSFVTLGAILSKKASQLLRLLSDGDNIVDAADLESSAAMLSAAKVLISSLDRNPTSVIEDYQTFRELVLRNSLQITAALSEAPEYDKKQLTEMVMMIVKATSVLISPDILSGNQPLELIKVVLIPDNKFGLGISMEKTASGVLLITNIQPGSPADMNGRICAGDEVVQVNQQNVIGWEVSYVVECLKANEFQVSLILKPGVGPGSPKLYQNVTTQQRHYSNGSEISNHLEPQDYMQPLSIQDTVDVQEIHDNRTFGSPLSDASSHSTEEEKPVQIKPMKGLPKNFYIPPPPKESFEDFVHNSETDSGKVTPDSGNLHSSNPAFDSAIGSSDNIERNLSDFEPEHDYVEPPIDIEPQPKKPAQKQKMPNISYKTQIVGGVVHRIPITAGAVIEGEPSLGPESPKISRGSIRTKVTTQKKPAPKPKQPGAGILSTKLPQFTKRHAKQ